MKYNRSNKYMDIVKKAFEEKGYFVAKLSKKSTCMDLHLIAAKGQDIFFINVVRNKIFSKQARQKMLDLKEKTGLRIFVTYSNQKGGNRITVREIK